MQKQERRVEGRRQRIHRAGRDLDRVQPHVNADARFLIYSDDEKLGELRVSKGTVDWWPARRRQAISMSWERFDRVMQDVS